MAASSSTDTSAPSSYSCGSGMYTPTNDQSSSNSESDDDAQHEQREVVSLLDRLKKPAPAAIARSRKTRKNQPPRGKRTCRGALLSDPKGVSPGQRVREFPGESFTVHFPK